MVTIYKIDKIIKIEEIKRTYFAGLFADYIYASIQKLGLKTFDALHIACAIETGCDYFLTTDDSVLKKLSGFDKIKALNPIELISILEEK